MKKKFLIPATAFSMMLSLGLSACGDNKPKEPEQKEDEKKEEKIVVKAAGDKKKLIKGETVQLTAYVGDVALTGVKFTSSKNEVATVDGNGLVTSVGKGSTSIKVEKDGYTAGTISITVELEKITVTAAGDKKSLLAEETVQLTASKDGVTWESSDSTIATVSATGLVTAVKFGSVTITAKKDGFDNGTMSISVVRPDPTAVLHLEDALHDSADGWYSSTSSGSERGPGATPIYNKDNASDGTCVAYLGAGDKEVLTFSSSAATKAEVVFFIGYYYEIPEIADSLSVKFNGADVNIAGQSYTPEDTSNYTYQGITLGEVDLVSGNNVLTIEAKGENGAYIPYFDDVNIYAKTAATISVVKPADPIQITLDKTAVSLKTTETTAINVAVEGVKFSSSNTAVATVDEHGVVTALTAGSANITVFKSGYLSARVALTVTEKPAEGEIRIEAEDATPSSEAITYRTPSSSSKASGAVTNAWPVNETLTFNFTADKAAELEMSLVARANPGDTGYTYTDVDLATMVEITLNGTKVNASGTISGSTITPYSLGMVNVVAGPNVVVIKNLELAPTIDYIKFAPKAAPSTDETEVALINAKNDMDATLGHDFDSAGSDYVRFDTSKYRDSTGAGTGSVFGYKFNVASAVAAGKAKLYVEAAGHNQTSSLFAAQSNDSAVGYISDGAGGFVNPTDYRIHFKINGVKVALTADTESSGTSKAFYVVNLADFALKAGENTLEVEGTGGYRAKFYSFKFVSVK